MSTLTRDNNSILHLALNEAEALAWQNGFPELIFPTLALEKANHTLLSLAATLNNTHSRVAAWMPSPSSACSYPKV